ncbi:ANKRD44 [Symbiodinium sp. CCMP2456]|nr:ANKRD44 [Symbiodinium sp. CCMP2456]
MPVPWPDSPTTINRPEDRGITVQQLRDLKLFLQRLCKTGQLKKDGWAVDWHRLNQYHISELVLVPVITHLHAKCKLEGQPRRSWVELVASGPQPPEILVSHSWAGRFRDFMAVVDNLLLDRGWSSAARIWVCTFANSQFGEHFGPTLEESPFFHAISLAKGTVLVVDRDAHSLTRIWCGLELHFTEKLRKDLQVYTPSGRIGSTRVTSGPLVEAIACWDVTSCEASQPSDRRQILNYLAHPAKEKDGLLKDDKGNLVFENGWRKVLEDDHHQPWWTPLSCHGQANSRTRADGKPEYKHETVLFKQHADAFSKLNQLVRDKVKIAASATETIRSGRPCTFVPIPIEQRGVLLGHVRAFFKSLRLEIQDGTHLDWGTVTTRTVVHEILEKRYSDTSYAETVNAGPTCAKYVIEHMWNGRFSDLEAGIEWFAEARQLNDLSAIWLDVLCARCGNVACQVEALKEGAGFRKNRDSDGRAFLWPGHGVEINRAWFMHALHVTRTSAKSIDFVSSMGAVACSVAFPDGSWALGSFDVGIANQLLYLDASQSKADRQKDVDYIIGVLGSAKGGFNRFHQRLRRIAVGPVLRDAAARGRPEDLAQILQVCASSGLVINSSSLGGSLGEKATHVAAAGGHVEMLEALLNLAADPNAQDHINETPLHYAAFSGHLDCVKLLLSRSANICAESAFGETPLDVAADNVAEFSGVETGRICTLLEIWEGHP